MKYVVVDGYALAYRAFYAYPELTNGQRDTRVTVGFFKQIIPRIGEAFLDSQLVFVFDSKGGSFRNSLDASYKANRSSSTPAFYEQVEEIVGLCKLIGPTYQVEGYEADDLAGSFVEQYVGPDDEALLLTVDADWLQLLRPNVTMLQLKPKQKAITWTRETFYESYSGLTPIQLIDLKAIQGDGSDNVPGVKGCGWVTAHKLLTDYKSVEGIYDNILKIPNKGGVQVNLMEAKERVFLNKKLVTIQRDVTLSDPKEFVEDSDKFLDYLHDVLKADSLVNFMGFFFQTKKAEESK